MTRPHATAVGSACGRGWGGMVVALAVTTGILVVQLTRPSNGRVVRPAGSAPAVLERAWLDTYPDFVVRRDWKLTGAKGDRFEATEAIFVTAAKPLPEGSRYLQVIPKQLAAHDSLVKFVKSTPQVVQRDPVFNIPLHGALPDTYAFVNYSINVPKSGRDADRLTKWNGALDDARKALKDGNPDLHVDIPKVTQVTPTSTLSDATPVAPTTSTTTTMPPTLALPPPPAPLPPPPTTTLPSGGTTTATGAMSTPPPT
jgi:hypothetical protein